MKKTLLGTAAVLVLAAAPAFAGGKLDPIVENIQIMAPEENEAKGSLISSGENALIPLAGLLLLGLAISAATDT